MDFGFFFFYCLCCECFFIDIGNFYFVSHGSVDGLEEKCLSCFHPQDMETLMVDTWISDRDSIVGDREEVGYEEHRRSYKF